MPTCLSVLNTPTKDTEASCRPAAWSWALLRKTYTLRLAAVLPRPYSKVPLRKGSALLTATEAGSAAPAPWSRFVYRSCTAPR